MFAIKSETEGEEFSSPDDSVEVAPRADSSHGDLALFGAALAPLAIVGLLILIGVHVGIAVCVTFVSVFAVTTTMDVRWLLRGRRSNNAGRGTRA